MTISYVLHKNKLTNDPDSYKAMIHYRGAVDLDGVIDRMVNRGSTVTRADILAVLQDYFAVIDRLALEGFKVITPAANYGVSVKGVFEGPGDRFDPDRHTVVGTVSQGVQFRKTIREKARLEKKEAVKPSPHLLAYFDFESNEANKLATPGGVGKISGYRLKVDPADPRQGVFFINNGGAVRTEAVVHNKPGVLMFIVPATLTGGDYRLEVRVVFGKDELRRGVLGKILAVA